MVGRLCGAGASPAVFLTPYRAKLCLTRERQFPDWRLFSPLIRKLALSGSARTECADLGSFENVNLETRGELESGSTGERLPCDSSCASANSNRVAPIRSGRNSSCDTMSPTSDSHTAAVRTSSCIASLRLLVRSGSSTSVFSWPKQRWGTDWPGRHRRPSQQRRRFEGHDGFCERTSLFILEWGTEQTDSS